MKKQTATLFALLAAPVIILLAACNHPAPVHTPSTGLPLQGSADAKSVLLGNQSYHLTQAKSFPLIDQWIYSLPQENPTQWTKRIEINRYKQVNAQEIHAQMVAATEGRMGGTDTQSRTICFVTERNGGQLKEANIWRYADVTVNGKTQTYGNGILWQFPSGMAFNTFMKGEFPNTCTAMRTLQLITPPAL